MYIGTYPFMLLGILPSSCEQAPESPLGGVNEHMERDPDSAAILAKAQQHKFALPIALRAQTSCSSGAQSNLLTYKLVSK